MKIISYNVNGIRAAIKKGFIEWLKTQPVDVICIQEIKAHESDIDRAAIESAGYKSCFFLAQKKGYSGVGILSKTKPDKIVFGHGREQSDFEGRVLRTDLEIYPSSALTFLRELPEKYGNLINTFGWKNF
jgi:exodeoxyribonuclease-3